MSEIDNQNSHRKKISAFASAKMDFSIRAEIGTDDVRAMRPAWSEEECVQFLRQFGDAIGQEMAMAGAIILATLLKGDGHDN